MLQYSTLQKSKYLMSNCVLFDVRHKKNMYATHVTKVTLKRTTIIRLRLRLVKITELLLWIESEFSQCHLSFWR